MINRFSNGEHIFHSGLVLWVLKPKGWKLVYTINKMAWKLIRKIKGCWSKISFWFDQDWTLKFTKMWATCSCANQIKFLDSSLFSEIRIQKCQELKGQQYPLLATKEMIYCIHMYVLYLLISYVFSTNVLPPFRATNSQSALISCPCSEG